MSGPRSAGPRPGLRLVVADAQARGTAESADDAVALARVVICDVVDALATRAEQWGGR